MSPDDVLAFETRVIERLKVGVQQAVSPSIASSVDMRVVADETADRLVARLSAYVLGEHLARDVYTTTVDVPASWREHRRRSWRNARSPLLRWWARRRPPRTTPVLVDVRVDRYVSYPDSTIVVDPALGRAAPIEIVRGPDVRGGR